jgi:DNA-binding winged helix-turn-helix (wHTH) protein
VVTRVALMESFRKSYDSAHMLTIGRWTVDPRDGTVTSNGCVTRLEPKVMAVLVELFEHQGEVVTHDELMRRVWLDTHVAPGALARTISILRRALEDDAKAPVYIHTVPKRGYRLQLAAAPARHSTADPSHLRRVALAVVLAMLALVPIADRPRVTRKPTLFTGRFVDRSRAGNESAYAYYARALAADPSSSDAHAGVAIAYAFRADYLPEPARWRPAAIDLAQSRSTASIRMRSRRSRSRT